MFIWQAKTVGTTVLDIADTVRQVVLSSAVPGEEAISLGSDAFALKVQRVPNSLFNARYEIQDAAFVLPGVSSMLLAGVDADFLDVQVRDTLKHMQADLIH